MRRTPERPKVSMWTFSNWPLVALNSTTLMRPESEPMIK
jgi:hypothetical protein